MPDGGQALTHPFAAPEAGGAVEVADGILWLRLPVPGPLRHVDVYALRDADTWTLVDTGLDIPPVREAWSALLDGPLAGAPVGRVILTHHHPDHVGLAGWFAEMGAEILATRTAYLMARMLTLDVQERPTPRMMDFWRGAGMDADRLAARAENRPLNFADMVAPLPLGYRRITDGEIVRAGGRDWTVRTGGGHAPEQATLWSADGEVVIVGDLALPTISPNLGVYATEPAADPVGDALAALDAHALHASDAQLVLPGHRGPYRGLPARLADLARLHREALDRLQAHLTTPASAAGTFDAIYGRAIGDGEYGLALGEALGHCLRLWHAGRARRWRDGDGPWLFQATGGEAAASA